MIEKRFKGEVWHGCGEKHFMITDIITDDVTESCFESGQEIVNLLNKQDKKIKEWKSRYFNLKEKLGLLDD